MRAWFTRMRLKLREILRAHLTPEGIGWDVAIGVFIGCLPIYGIHIFACVAVARWLKLNQGLVYLAANISNPLFAPFLVAAEVALGELIRYGEVSDVTGAEEAERNVWEWVTGGGDLFLSCLLGSVVIGAVLGLVLGWISLLVARRRVPRPAVVDRP